MRTNIEIDDKLMAKAMKAAKTATKKETVEAALKLIVQMDAQERALHELWGKVKWEGNLDEMRRD